MRGKRWVRRVLILVLSLGLLGLASHAGAIRIVRAWGEGSSGVDGHWADRPWCLSPSRPYLCLLEYRFRVGGGLADWFADPGVPDGVTEHVPSK